MEFSSLRKALEEKKLDKEEIDIIGFHYPKEGLKRQAGLPGRKIKEVLKGNQKLREEQIEKLLSVLKKYSCKTVE